MPPPTKRQRKESAGSGALHDDENRASCPAAGQAEARANKKQRKDCAHDTLLKDEWRKLSRTAKSRHVTNEVRARIRTMIPGAGTVSENSLMLHAASRIRELEIEIHSAYNYLERLQKQSTQSGAEDNLKYQSVAAAVPATEQGGDGAEAIRSVLPQPTKAKGSRLMVSAWQYMTELTQERDQAIQQIASIKDALKPRDQVIQQIAEHQGCTEAKGSGDSTDCRASRLH